MTAFDTDVFTHLIHGDLAILARVSNVPVSDRVVPIVVAEEVLRGRLNSVRQSSMGRGATTSVRAYELLQETLLVLRPLTMLAYTNQADIQFQSWRRQKIRVGTRDLRIAAIAVAHAAKLVTRNLRDFGLVPGLNVEVW